MQPNGKHALVIGGSMAGLLTARVLTDHFERVTIVERDRLPDGPELRSGAPQARHVHALLARGQDIMESLFPGLADDLTTAGAPTLHWGENTRYFTAGGWLQHGAVGITTKVCSRALLEYTIRKRLMDGYPVEIMSPYQVIDLCHTPDNARVTGVKLRSRGGKVEESTVEADLVIDASGRVSKAPDWLDAMGYPRPEETVIDSHLVYTTRWYKKNPNVDWQTMFVNAKAPEIPRGGAVFEVEGDMWMVTLAGIKGSDPPLDNDAWVEYAKTLAVPDIYEAIKDAEPLTKVYGYQRTANRLRHYEKLPALPDGFIVIGDAVCGFNPVYGQGMSIAAMEAETLDEMLTESSDLAGFPVRFQKALAETVKTPWLLATGEDLRFPTTEGAKPDFATRFSQRYVDYVLKIMPNDADLTRQFVQVMNLRAEPTILFTPGIMWKVARRAVAEQFS